ncbi:hypothetical protein, partial [Streptomyces niveus]
GLPTWRPFTGWHGMATDLYVHLVHANVRDHRRPTPGHRDQDRDRVAHGGHAARDGFRRISALTRT